jgi:DNA polymerase II small subunit/DNA polymerase delta subunit B
MKKREFFRRFEGGWCVYDMIDTLLSNHTSRTKKTKLAETQEEEKHRVRVRSTKSTTKGIVEEDDRDVDMEQDECQSDQLSGGEEEHLSERLSRKPFSVRESTYLSQLLPTTARDRC